MLARAILILSCLLCTRALAQAPAVTADPNVAIVPTEPTEPSAPTTTTSAEVSTNPTSTPTPPPEDPQAIQNAVPFDRAALEPATEPAPKRPLESDPLFTPSVVLIGTGGAALLASLFTGLGAHGIYTSLEKECPNDICTGDKQQRIDSGKTLATVSTVLTGVGIAAAGVGTVLMVLAATNDDQPPSNFGFARIRLTSGPTPLGVGAAGSF
jgi:hypothetical protein